jgi:hypothetical protein
VKKSEIDEFYFFILLKTKMENKINLKNIWEFIQKRINEKPKVANFLASTVKNARLSKHLTLAQTVKDICSQSSWSKFENNYLSLPEDIVSAVCDGIGLNYGQLIEIDQTNNLPTLAKHYLYNRNEEIEKMFDNIDNELFLSRDALIKCCYYLLKEDFQNFVIEVENLDSVKNTLSDYELFIFLLFTIEYNIKTNSYLEADRYLNIIDILDNDDQILKSLYLQQKFIVACNLRNYKRIHLDYINLEKATSISYPIKNRVYMKLLFLEAYPTENNLLELENMEYDLPDYIFNDCYWYTRLIVLIELGRLYEVINLIIKLDLKHISFIGLLGYVINAISETDRHVDGLKEYIKHFNDLSKNIEYTKYDTVHLEFIKYIKIKINSKNTDEEFLYLRNALVPKIKSCQHRFYTQIYASRYALLLGERSKYKEAYLFSINNYELLNDLHLHEL